jgi:UPF0755 protein
MATFVSNLFYLLLTCLISVYIAIISFQLYYDKPGPSEHDQLLIINKGQSVANIASHLKELNLIENRMVFILVVRLKGFHDKIKFGEYMISKTASIREILDSVITGVSVQNQITIPEGLSTISVIHRLNNDLRIRGDLISFSEEGVLAPNTYSFDVTTNKKDLFLKMRNNQERILEAAWNNRDPDLPLKNALELLILASIVEKEAGNEEDKKKVASVFLNRLKKKMRLQSDPTVVYSLTKGREPLNRELNRGDLKTKSPFNTYKIAGLPPSPICNPSKSSIHAVANPLKTDFLFFVANGEGGHNFSKNLKQHNSFVKEYRRLKSEN